MRGVQVSLRTEDWLVTEEPADRVSAEESVNTDIQSFNDFFQGLGNEPLTRPEKAIIKTYLAWKLGLVKKPSSD